MTGRTIFTTSHKGDDRKEAHIGAIIIAAFVVMSGREPSEAWRRHYTEIQSQPGLNDVTLLAIREGEGDYLLVHDLAPDQWETATQVEESIRLTFGAENILDLARFERIYAATDARALSAAAEFVFLARADVDPAIDHEKFNRWYDNRHVPDVAGAGLVRAQRFRREGAGNEYLASYEIASPSVLESAELARVRGFHEFTPWIRLLRRTVAQPAGRQVAE